MFSFFFCTLFDKITQLYHSKIIIIIIYFFLFINILKLGVEHVYPYIHKNLNMRILYLLKMYIIFRSV